MKPPVTFYRIFDFFSFVIDVLLSKPAVINVQYKCTALCFIWNSGL